LLPAPPKIFNLLLILLENRHRVVPRQELLTLVWTRLEVSRGALPQSMLKLRKLLGGDKDSERWIATVRGVGYRFVGEVRIVSAAHDGRPSTAAGTAKPERRTLGDVEVTHRVDVLNQRAQEQAIQLDHDGLRQTVATLLDREACGADPRARVFGLCHQSVLDRRAGDLDRCWQTLQSAERLSDQLAVPLCQVSVLRAMGQFFLQFVSYAEAIPWFHRAFEVADRARAGFETADCAFFLAGSMGRAGDEAGCEEWTQRACDLARQVKPDWLWTYVCASLAGTHVHLGERALDAEDMPRARRHWVQALQMLDDADAAGNISELGHFATVLPINRAWVRGYLHPEQRVASIEMFRGMLATETVPQIQLSHLLGLTTFLIEEGRLEEARGFCDQGLALGDSTRIFRHRVGFLSHAADISTRQGRHADAGRQLRAQLRWQDETARSDAVRIAKVTALRLQTERALAVAELERNLSLQLESENQALRREVQLRGTEDRFEQTAGVLGVSAFKVWLMLELARARMARESLALILIDLDVGRGAGSEPRRNGLVALDARLIECLHPHLRASDRCTQLDSGRLVVALSRADVDRARLVAARLRRDLTASMPTRRGELPGLSISVVDAAPEPDAESAWRLASGPVPLAPELKPDP